MPSNPYRKEAKSLDALLRIKIESILIYVIDYRVLKSIV